MKKKVGTIIGLALVVGLLVYAFAPQPVEVAVATLERGPLQVTVNEDGKTRIKERYVISTPLAGRIPRVELRPGDVVKRGETLITTIEPTDPELLDPRRRAEAEARVKAAQATIEQARPLLERAHTAHDFSRTNLTRLKKLYEEKAISQQVIDEAEQRERLALEEAKSAGFSVQIAEYEFELAQAALMRGGPDAAKGSDPWRFKILSAIDGRVLRVFQESSTVVQAGDRLVELGDPADLEVEIDVLSGDAVKISPGTRIILEHWGGEKPLQARVRLVEPAAFTKISALGVEEQRVNVIADFTDPPEKRSTLGDGFRVEARIVTWEADDVLKVPMAALFRRGDQWAAFVVDGGRAKVHYLDLGRRNDLEAEVLGGVEEGAVVIVHPGDRITDGIRVSQRSSAD